MPNLLTRTVTRLRGSGRTILDLTESNPTRAELPYPPDLLAPLGGAAGLAYRPEPFGLSTARAAVAADFARRDARVVADRLVLTSSTSEAYSWLFKLLCEPADAVLVPRPSYPLFEQLARLDAVRLRPYRLEYDGAWSVDLESVRSAIDERTRAILMVHPNNPTGSLVADADLAALLEIGERHRLALVVDEVFADYPLEAAGPIRSAVASDARWLVVSLGGLSKTAGLPQAKLAWMALTGPDPVVRDAMARLEYIADAYLPVSTPVQEAAGALLAGAASVRAAIGRRVRTNYDRLRGLANGGPCTVLRADAGWSAVVRVPATRSEDRLALELLEQDGVLVHPGYFFDLPSEAYVVVSLLPPPRVFEPGAARLLARASR